MVRPWRSLAYFDKIGRLTLEADRSTVIHDLSGGLREVLRAENGGKQVGQNEGILDQVPQYHEEGIGEAEGRDRHYFLMND